MARVSMSSLMGRSPRFVAARFIAASCTAAVANSARAIFRSQYQRTAPMNSRPAKIHGP
jgi:hypothetical protein